MSKRDQAKRRVRTGNEQIDETVVQHFEDAFRLVGGYGVIERGHEVFQQHGNAVDQRSKQQHAPAMGNSRHDKDRNCCDGEQDADAVRDGVRHLFAQRVFAHVPLALHRVRARARRLARDRPNRLRVSWLEL